MRALQYRHLPFRATYEKSGMRSYQRSCVLHEGHALLPPSSPPKPWRRRVLFSPRRKITTLRKLPTIRPRAAIDTKIMRLVLHEILETNALRWASRNIHLDRH